MDVRGQIGPTPSSEIIHLVSTFADTLDALPPSLTRSLSDLKELDAVLSGSLQTITAKLQLLLTMMNTPPPGSSDTDDKPQFTPLQRLQLLREVTEEARIFRLGGEDKIRVATGTCETIATHTSHLSTLSSLLLSFLPAHLLPQLPPPTAPHGYPCSSTPASALARRQNFDYPPSQFQGSGGTTRMNAAHGMAREHWELTRGNSSTGQPAPPPPQSKRKTAAQHHHHHHHHGSDAADLGSIAGGGAAGSSGTYRQPNQYTNANGTSKKKHSSTNSASSHHHAGAAGGVGGVGILDHPMGVTAVDSVKAKQQTGAGGNAASGVASSAGGTAGRQTHHMYPGMASAEEYAAATGGSTNRGGSQKRKVDDSASVSKRRKTKGEASPDITARTIPNPPGSSNLAGPAVKPPRRANNTANTNSKVNDANVVNNSEIDMGVDGDGDGDDDGEGQTYCVCNQGSFGEMIGCDGSDCEREWFHLSCVGLQAIPKGRWFCDDCRQRANEKGGKKRR
ncbi:hypothetical protein T439DRAFT_19763 [Meredithblackwellia eburnea MCA 4105]